ncbi:hypothetical protein EIP86_011301 [Pleurotus ostreatoroseus]|nr:hypothetical protein EIP86_011301 [Pleurotus ostreatoroseus]
MSHNLVEPFMRMLDVLQSGLPVDADEQILSSKLDDIQVALDTVENIVRIAAQPVRDGLATIGTRLWTKVARDSFPCLRESPQPDFQTRYAEAFATQFRQRNEPPMRFVEASQQTDSVTQRTEWVTRSVEAAQQTDPVIVSPLRSSIDALPIPTPHSVEMQTPGDRDPTPFQEYPSNGSAAHSAEPDPPYTLEEEETGRGYLGIIFGSAGPPHPRAGETVGEFVDRVKRLDYLETFSGKQLILPHIRACIHSSETARYYTLARLLFFQEENIQIHRSFAAAMRAELRKLAGLYAEVSDTEWLLAHPGMHDHHFSDNE